jgi:hypothetical protein
VFIDISEIAPNGSYPTIPSQEEMLILNEGILKLASVRNVSRRREIVIINDSGHEESFSSIS